MTADQVLSDRTLIGCDLCLMTTNDRKIHRGPIKDIRQEHDKIVFELEWWAESIPTTNLWQKTNPRPCFITKSELRIHSGPRKQWHFIIPRIGQVTIYCDCSNQLVKSNVLGFEA